MVRQRFRSAVKSLPCTCWRYHSTTASSSPYPIASTSRTTLDDPLPTWQDLLGAGANGSEAPEEAGTRQAYPLSRCATNRPPQLPPSRPPSSAPSSGPSAPQPERVELIPPDAPIRPFLRDRSQISPYLPLVTLERNHLLSELRKALFPHSVRRRDVLGRARPDAVWVALARVLRYPTDLPALPSSEYPTSTRAGKRELDDGEEEVSRREKGEGHDEAGAEGFFTSSHPSAEDSHHDIDREKITLSLSELRRAFTIFASARPRSVTGLHRLLVVAELIAQQTIANHPSSLPMHPISMAGLSDDLHRLTGGGVGLRDKDWTSLVLFVGASMRTAKAEQDVGGAMALFSQWLETRQLEQQQQLQASDSSSSPASTRLTHRERGADARDRSSQQRLYNALLFVVGRARMWDLFDQVLRRMKDEGFEGDCATIVELIKREDKRAGPLLNAWRYFEQAVATPLYEEGREHEVEAVWAAMLWVYARQGRFDEAMRMYEAMRARATVSLDDLRPSSPAAFDRDWFKQGFISSTATTAKMTSISPATAGITIRAPPVNDRVYTSLLQAFAFRGELHSALRILRHVSESTDSAIQPSTHHFSPIFQAFANHGGGFYGNPAASVNETLIKGTRQAAAKAVRGLRGARGGETTLPPEDPFTLDNLVTIFQSFLSISAPSSSSHPSLPYLGARTAPTARQVFWILFAFDKLSQGDSELVLEVWGELVLKFDGEVGRRKGWTGWYMDNRVLRLVRTHEQRAADRLERLRALE
ncbi:serine/arginine repetitive matrix 2, isoform CRA a [Rhodotorula toruloides]|uniref:Serine/arginine repetitive matrix 2, isoform CRA a n=1 Tax=Rhodotorula toruloides TaxID=5286 RepID=A0A511K9W1_RHOTO|nr:serine/arginine repetitive matrix 2, isoform CRA a [Rhodotorula toruloides]